MRFAEVLALSWADIDFASGVIHVRSQLARARRGVPPRRIPPKTRASLREIPLLPQLAALLLEHRRRSPSTGPEDYVFCTRDGRPYLHRNAWREVFEKPLRRSGLYVPGAGRLRFHDLRHTYASHLIIDVRLDVAQVSRILGHARTSITLDIYTHLFEVAAHGQAVRVKLARSDFAMLLARTANPVAREHASRASVRRRPRWHCTPKASRGRTL